MADWFVDKVVGLDTNDGQSWGLPYKTIGKALDSATFNENVIWVKAYANDPHYVGSSSTSDPRAATFMIEGPIILRGGFAGDETRLSDRPENLFEDTILSGDIDMDSPGMISDDAYTVVTIAEGTSGAIIDGFRIVHGNANGNDLNTIETRGGGLATEISSGGYDDLMLRNLVIEDCRAELEGGGMYLNAVGDSVVSQVTIRQCIATEEVSMDVYEGRDGGGLYVNSSGGGLRFINCALIGNRAGIGGGMRVQEPNGPILFQTCLFRDNNAASAGGIYWKHGVNGQLNHCTVAYNNASSSTGSANGAGLIVEGASTGRVTASGSIFWNNVGTYYPPSGPPLQTAVPVVATGGNFLARYSCVEFGLAQSQPTGTPPTPPAWFDQQTSISINPQFNNGGIRDLTLAANSPCLDRGDDTVLLLDAGDLDDDDVTDDPMPGPTEFVPLDLSGQPREVDIPGTALGVDGGNLTNGEIADMGAFERQK